MKLLQRIGVDRRGRTWVWAGPTERPRRVVGVGEACRRLKRSRRQVYRYLRSGALRPRIKFLGEWLLDAEDLEQRARGGIPRRLQVLFPEHAVSALHPARDRSLILSRVLERGTRAHVRWAFDRYRPREISEFLRADGRRLLTAWSDRFWRLYFGVRGRDRRPFDRGLGKILGGGR